MFIKFTKGKQLSVYYKIWRGFNLDHRFTYTYNILFIHLESDNYTFLLVEFCSESDMDMCKVLKFCYIFHTQLR
jgi:hypothetical protein